MIMQCIDCSTEQDGQFVAVIDVSTNEEETQTEEEIFYCVRCFQNMMRSSS